MINFSPEQLQAINATDNIIISAGAGSGKTAVMIENIITKLLHSDEAKRAALENMLIVTFTRAAASDMRVKLSARLNELRREALSAGDAQRVKTITEAIDEMPVCDIGTLHGFCQRLIKTYFYAAGIDPSAVVMDEDEAEMIKYAAAKSVVRAYRAHSAETIGESKADGDDGESAYRAFDTVCDALCRRNSDEVVVGLVISIAEFALSTPDPVGYLLSRRNFDDVCAELDEVVQRKKAAFLDRIAALKYDAECAKCDVLAAALGDFGPYLDGESDIRRTSVKSGDPLIDELNDRYKALKDKCKKMREYIVGAEEAKKRSGAEFGDALRRAAFLMLEKYRDRKQALGKIDYSDLEHGAKRVLADETANAELARKIKYVFIDEYQDVNELQAEIADRLKGFAKMFLVGDVKQSIYGFRRCNPKYFLRALDAPDYEHIVLNRNYRSSAQVIDFVNSVFTVCMTEEFGGVDYAKEKLICGRPDLNGDAELVLVECGDTDETESEEEPTKEIYSVKEASGEGAIDYDGEARFVAARIAEYLSDGKKRAGDVAVLVRSTKTRFCADLARLLAEQGISCRFGRKSTLSDYPEVTALVDVLRSVDNRFDDVALYTALRSPMGRFSDEELLEIAQDGDRRAHENNVYSAGRGRGRKRYPFWQKVDNYDGRHKARLDEFFALRDEFRAESKRSDCADTIGYITSRTNYFQYVYDYFEKGAAEAVEAFIKLATSRRTDVHSFLDFIDNTDVALGTDGGDDAVTVTTIHASKGLEYDFVIVADTTHGFNMQDVRKKIIVSESGVSVKYPDAPTRTLLPTAEWLLEREKAPDAVREEEMRLFYVALTRAKSSLLVCGKAKNRKETENYNYGCYLDFAAHMPHLTETPPERVLPSVAIDEAVDERTVEIVKRSAAALPISSDSPIKTCVTAIAESSDEDYTSGALKLTIDDGREDALARGTAYHRAMELIDFSSPDFEGIKAKCDNVELVDERKILTAVAAMKELTENCSFYYKERYFIVDLDGGEIAPETYGKGERVLVQGVIDLLIVDGDGNATVVDYKTTATDGLDSAAYSTQLRLYADAVESTTPLKVVKTCLYSFVLDKIIDVPLRKR